MSRISTENVNEIIRKTLGIVNEKLVQHGEIVGYILNRMLTYEEKYTQKEIWEYSMLGWLHDLGLFREGKNIDMDKYEYESPWAHSIYGFLFLKYLSPLGNKADIVLYHHLNYNRYQRIESENIHIIECLAVADKMANFMQGGIDVMGADYFARNRDITFSGKAFRLFRHAEQAYSIRAKLASGDYQEEFYQALNKISYNEVQKKGFLEMIAYIIDFRSEHTVVHTMSTVNFAVQLGNLLHLSAAEVNALYYGALLHDIGKIAIPLNILESTGRLSDEEMRVMKAHVRITEMILEGCIDEEIERIAARHHEKLDGSGYHKGLKEADLTFPQQIVAVADILSALYGKRSYKESFDSNLIKKIINEDADNHKISKKAVDCLMENYDDVIANYEKEKDQTIGLYLKIKEQFGVIMKKFENF